MTYVVVELCVDCKYTDCAAVCPVEAFHELPDRLYINADTCIDCDACVPECPVEAIFADTNVPEQYAHWTDININLSPVCILFRDVSVGEDRFNRALRNARVTIDASIGIDI